MATSHIARRLSPAPGRARMTVSPQQLAQSDSHRLTRNGLLFADFVLVWLGSSAAWWLRFAVISPSATRDAYWASYGRHASYLYLYSVLFLLFAYARKLYSPPRRPHFSSEILDVLKVSLTATVALSAFIYISGNRAISREVVAGTLVCSFIFLIGWRAFLRFPGVAGLTETRNVLIIGAG